MVKTEEKKINRRQNFIKGSLKTDFGFGQKYIVRPLNPFPMNYYFFFL